MNHAGVPTSCSSQRNHLPLSACSIPWAAALVLAMYGCRGTKYADNTSMPTQTEEITAREIVTFDDVKRLASASSPCVTILIHIRDPRELSPKLKGALRIVE